MNKISKIVVPVDFSEITEKIITTGAFFAQTYGAELQILHVVEYTYSYSGLVISNSPFEQFGAELLRKSEERLAALLEKQLGETTISLLSKVYQGNPAEEILKYTDKVSPDLLIMGTHGYRGLEKMLMGSVVDKVLKISACPVLVIK